MNTLKVENHSGLIRDLNTSAILNTNIDELNAYRLKRNLAIQKESEKDNLIKDLSNRIINLESLMLQMINTHTKE